jgi:hypothetical protein
MQGVRSAARAAHQATPCTRHHPGSHPPLPTAVRLRWGPGRPPGCVCIGAWRRLWSRGRAATPHAPSQPRGRASTHCAAGRGAGVLHKGVCRWCARQPLPLPALSLLTVRRQAQPRQAQHRQAGQAGQGKKGWRECGGGAQLLAGTTPPCAHPPECKAHQQRRKRLLVVWDQQRHSNERGRTNAGARSQPATGADAVEPVAKHAWRGRGCQCVCMCVHQCVWGGGGGGKLAR